VSGRKFKIGQLVNYLGRERASGGHAAIAAGRRTISVPGQERQWLDSLNFRNRPRGFYQCNNCGVGASIRQFRNRNTPLYSLPGTVQLNNSNLPPALSIVSFRAASRAAAFSFMSGDVGL
jgi:hypothetical protein